MKCKEINKQNKTYNLSTPAHPSCHNAVHKNLSQQSVFQMQFTYRIEPNTFTCRIELAAVLIAALTWFLRVFIDAINISNTKIMKRGCPLFDIKKTTIRIFLAAVEKRDI